MADAKNDKPAAETTNEKQQDKPEVAFVNEEGKTETRPAEKGEDKAPDLPEPLGTDPQALGADGKEEYLTQKDAEKAAE